MLLGCWAYELREIRRSAYQEAETMAGRAAFFAAEHLAMALRQMDLALGDVAQTDPSASDASAHESENAAQRLIKAPYVRGYAHYDAEGRPLGRAPTSVAWIPPVGVMIDHLVLAPPARGSASGDPLTLAHPGSDGARWVLAHFDAAALTATINRVQAPAGWSMLLFGLDGRALLRIPAAIGAAAQPDNSSEVARVANLAVVGGGATLALSPFDGRRRLVGVAPMAELPLGVAVTFPADAVDSAIQRENMRLALASLSALSLACVFFALLLSGVVRRERAAAAAVATGRAKSAFLAALSHELRTPLNAVVGFSELMRAQPKPWDEDSARTQLELVHNSGLHLQCVVDRVLDFVWIESSPSTLPQRPINLRELAVELWPTLSALAADHHQTLRLGSWSREGRGPAPMTMGDHFAARRVMEALTAFAARIAGEGGVWGLALHARTDGWRLIAWAGASPSLGSAWTPVRSRLNDIATVYAEPDPDALALETALRLSAAMGWRIELSADGTAASALAPLG